MTVTTTNAVALETVQQFLYREARFWTIASSRSGSSATTPIPSTGCPHGRTTAS